MSEREGRMRCEVIPGPKLATLREVIERNVEPGSIVSTDEWMAYALLERSGYRHGVATHSAKEYAYYSNRENVTHHTNTVEGFWRLFKRRFARRTSVSARNTWTAIWENYLPLEPPRDEERDVRPPDRVGVVAIRLIAAFRFF
jgi:transposase-like protein